MSYRTAALVLGFVMAAPTIHLAQEGDSWVGIWILNPAKSTYSSGVVPQSETVRLEAMPDGIKAVMDLVSAQGVRSIREVTAKFDGKPYELKGAPTPTTWSFTRIDSRTFDLEARVNGKVTSKTRVQVSADGRTRTNTTTQAPPRRWQRRVRPAQGLPDSRS